ncbi:tandem-95 repeat protein, partial [bacterium]|nr:tandem-95 repeat protein [bacterium]MBU1883433.1 tandem-95 repeat protein [bacterium]
GNGNDTIIGGAGNDTLNGGAGDDILEGGTGNDTLIGGYGNDTYIFNRGDGKDIIVKKSYESDTLQFAEGIVADDLEARLVGNDLVIGIKEDGVAFEDWSDKVTIQSNFINNIVLNDSTLISLSSIMTKPTEGDDILDYTYTQATITVDGLAGDDTITTSSGDDMIYGGDGNDTISSGVGSDTIDGGSGSDKLYAGAGNDTIIGGTGDDILDGGAGNDIYRFNRGDGKDMLSDSAGNDDIVFGDGITVDDVLFKQDNYDLTIALKADGVSFSDLTDKIIIADWFKQKNNIETIHFTDGSSMSASEIATILTDAQTDTLYSKQGAEIFGGMGDDTYVYKKGDFTVIIDDKFTNKEIAVNAGNDTLKFEDITQDKVTLGIKGDDLIIKIDADHDTYTELKDYVVVRDWKNPNRGIESIEFGDGEVLAIDKTAIYPELEFDENWITGRYYIYGSEDNNINGSKFSEEMESGAGNDVIDALAGNDYLIGGSGDDTINGGSGNDTYVFNIGDGHDTIFDTSGLDSIKFGSSIIRSDIVTTQVGTDLIMTLGANDSITLKDWFNEETIDHRVELMVLENEGEMAIADFLITPTEQNDNLEYGDEKNHIDALAGDDIIYIGGGDDVLFGGEGNDLLYGEDGDDTIAGDQGDDTLYGGEGDDIYLFGRGDGQDIIVENDFTDWSRSGNDTLKFKDGVTPDDLVLVENGEDLIVALKEDGKSFDDLSDKITLKKWALYDDENSRDISRDYYTVENFSFNDGTTWSMNDIISHIGSDENEDIAGFNQADTIEGKKGDDKLYGHLGDDTYVFNRGDGHDTIYDYGRKGDNYSYYNAGNDTLKFGEGITEDDLNITKYNNDVIIFIKDGNTPLNELEDSIIIKDWFISNNRIENMVLSDGTEIDYVKYLSIEPTIEDDSLIYGTGDDYVDALAGDDIVIALGGNNIINGNSGNDTIQTADGNDLLIGGDGNDTLDAGAGDDRLEGGLGDDTYIFNRGDGSNIVDDQDGLDSLKFGLDITQDDLVLYQDGNNLVVALKEDGVATLELQDKITLTNWLDASTRVENITFSDASVWDVPTMMSHLGSDGNDIIQSIELDDTLHGGEGNDTYIFNIGDGHDVIVDTNGTDKLLFGEGITVDDLLIKQDGNDLIVALKEDGVVFSDLANKITISNWTSQDNRVETIELADGTVLNANNVIEHIPSEEADTIVVPDELAVNIDLQGGDDVIQGSSQDDTILGGSGDDVISSGAGNDTLEGGTGDDTLHGGEGNDTYIFNIGDGHDVIVDTNGTDKLTFGSNITINDLTAQMDGNDIQIGIKEDGKNFAELTDVITIKDVMTTNTVNKIAFTNGQTFTKEQLYSMFIQQEVVLNFKTIFINGDDQNNILTVPSSSLSVVNGNGGNDEVNGNDGNDSLIGGAGDDYLDGGDGSDGYFYAVGDGKDIILDSGNSNTYSTINDALSFRSYEISNELMQGGYAYIEKNIGAQQYFASNFYVSDNTNYLFQTSQANVKIRIYSEEWQGFTSDGVKEVFTEVYTDENGKFVWNSSNNLGQPFVSIVIENISTEEMPVDLFVAKADEYDAMPRAAVPKQIGSDNDIIYFNLNGTMDSRVIAYIDGDDYVIAVSEDGVVREDLSNQIRIKNWQNSDNQIEKICFAYPDSCLELTYDNFLALAESQSLFEYANSRSEETIMGTNDDDIGDGSLYGSNSIDDIYGLDGSDSLYGNGGNDILWGDDERNYFSGNDTLYGGDGNDTLYGGRGNDTLWGDNGGEYHPSETDDAFYFYNEENMYYGGDDILYGGDGDDLLFGEGGNDILYGDNETGDYYGGNNTLYGGYGDDTLIGGLSHDSLYGGGGNDILLGDNRNDVFYGGSDDLYGGEGDDTLEGGIFDDNLYGGMGNDTYVVNLGDGYDTIYDDGSDPTYKIIYDDGGKPYQEQIQAPEVSKQDVIRLTSSVTSINDVHVELEGDDLLITVFHPSADGYDNIIRVRFGRYEEHTVETIELSNGETYNIADYFGINLTPGSYPTPIVLDLNGDGVTSVSLDDSNAYFDYNGDGLREHTAWAQRDDAMLVADLNGDGIINDATEHFGNSTRVPDGSIAQSGYEALAQYDTNGDNIIDNKDEAFGNLSLWQDKNQNGKTEEGELTNIQLTNVTAINLTQENGITFEQEMENGNLILNETNYKTFDGEGIIRDVGFAFNAMDTITNNDTLTTEFYGTTLSGADGDDKYIYNITDGDVVIDDNGSGDDTLVLQGITSDQAIVKWDKGTNNIVIGIKENEYDTSSFATLQNHIAIQRFFNESGSIEKFEFDDVILDKSQLYDILLNTKDTLPLTARVLDENSELTGGAKNDILYGTTGDEALSGNDGADYLNGLSGDDLLDGGYGDDTFIGGKGDDTLVDFGGDDFYIFNKGDGRDIVTDFTGDDIIMFGDDIVSSDVVFTQSGNDMILSFEYDKELPLQQRDSITIKNWQQDGFEIETLTFTNGESFSISRLETIKNNTAPELAADASSYTLQDVREMNGDVGATDEDGDTLTYTVTATAQHGTLSVDESGTWTYKVDELYMGEDSAVITVDDGNGGTVTKTLTFHTKVSVPSITTSEIDLKEDNLTTDTLSVTNPVGGTLTYEIVIPSANGNFSVDVNGVYSYDPNQDYNGADEVTIKVTNEYGLSTTTTLSLAIEAVNDAPVANMDSATIEENTQLVLNIADILANDTDVDTGDTMNITDVTIPTGKGVVSLDNTTGEFVFAPGSDFDHLAAGESEEVYVAYTIADAAGATSTSEIVITVTGTNDAPILEVINPIETQEDTAVILGNITSTDADDNATATYSTTETVAGFTLNSDGSYSFNPADDAYQSLAKDEIKEITIPITVTDDQNATDTKSLVITLMGTNDVPTVVNASESFTLTNIRNIDGKVEASDIDDSDVLTYGVSTQAQHGVVTVDENGNWYYKADGSFNGDDSAVITVDDGNGGSVTSMLNFTVKGYIYEGEDLVIDDVSGDDTLVMDNVDKDMLSFLRDGDNLLIKVQDQNTITLKNYFTDTNAGVNALRTAQGDIILTRDVINSSMYGGYMALDSKDHLISGDKYSNWLLGNNGNDIIIAQEGCDYISGGDGDDLLIGGDGNDNINAGDGDDNIYAGEGNDYIDAGRGNDTIIGGSGKDFLVGNDGDDWISGGSGSDTLYGGNGNDTLKGGSGDDLINGDSGSDTYLFNIGDGNDTVVDTSWYGSNDTDKIIFGEGISKDNLQILRKDYDLVFKANDNDSVTVKYWFGSDQRNTIEQLNFSDGSTFDLDEVNSLALTLGSDQHDWISGLNNFDDHIYAKDGNDSVYSFAGDDFISGGKGDDFLEGGSGSDTYVFDKGDGHDTINEWASWGADSDVDTIKFSDNITKEDVSFTLNGTNLLVQYGDNDIIKVANTYNANSPIERIELSDGNFLTNNDIDLVIQQINAYGCEKGMHHISNNDIQNNAQLTQIVSSAWHQ